MHVKNFPRPKKSMHLFNNIMGHRKKKFKAKIITREKKNLTSFKFLAVFCIFGNNKNFII